MKILSEQRIQLPEFVEAIRRMAPRGGYFLVGVSDAHLRKSLLRYLAKNLPKHLHPKSIKLSTDTEFSVFFQQHSNQILSIENLEELIQKRNKKQPETDTRVGILQFLNIHREIFGKHRILCVFWMKPETLDQMLWLAPDFWDGRIHAYRFERQRDYLKRPRKYVRLLQNLQEKYYESREQAETMIRKGESGDKLLRAFFNVGKAAREAGKMNEAMGWLEKALSISREIGDRAGEGVTLNNIGMIYHARGDYEQALKYYQESLSISREIGDRAGEGVTLNNIGQIYNARGDYEQALKYYQESLSIFREIGDRAGEGVTLDNIGQIYHARGDYEQALKYYQESLSIRREIGDRVGEGATLNNIGLIYHARGDYEQAL
ncbi:MAG: tetratricopeptide repeat protein, partial [Methanobacteriota archaeon]